MMRMDTSSDRLRKAREDAGYATISEAVKAMNWVYSTYAGHENGHRGMKMLDVEKYANAFKVQPEWIVTGRQLAAEPSYEIPPKQRPRGFSESAVSPFHPKSDTMRRKLIDLAQIISPKSRHVTFYQLTKAYPALMLMQGDVLIVDQKHLIAEEGGLVISQIVNEETGAGKTALRIQAGSGLQHPYGDPPTNQNEIEASIGTVVCSFRSPTDP